MIGMQSRASALVRPGNQRVLECSDDQGIKHVIIDGVVQPSPEARVKDGKQPGHGVAGLEVGDFRGAKIAIGELSEIPVDKVHWEAPRC